MGGKERRGSRTQMKPQKKNQIQTKQKKGMRGKRTVRRLSQMALAPVTVASMTSWLSGMSLRNASLKNQMVQDPEMTLMDLVRGMMVLEAAMKCLVRMRLPQKLGHPLATRKG